MIRPVAIGEFHRTLVPEMISDLDASDPAVAARAALAIGRTKQREGAAALRAHVHARDPGVRAMAVYALGLLSDQGSLAGVRAALADPNSAVRYAATDALGRIYAAAPPEVVTEDAANELLATGSNDVDPIVRGHALAQLDAFSKQPYAPAIATALAARESADADPGVRWHAAWMVYRGYASDVDFAFLAKAVNDPNELVRVETLRALGRRSELTAKTIAKSKLDDPSWRVQFEAREALRRLSLVTPTQHLRVMPSGIHLPATGDVPPEAVPVVSPVPVEHAPDPAVYALGATILPHSAGEMDGPVPSASHPEVTLFTTKGPVVLRLYPEWAPSTVANFLQLTANGYFNGNRWFRIVPDFVDQTGDPTDTGDGDAGYAIPAEENPIEQRGGIVAMGLNYDKNGAERDSAGTQFYVTLSPQLHLDRAFSVFGEVVSGMNVLATMDERDRIVVARETCSSPN